MDSIIHRLNNCNLFTDPLLFFSLWIVERAYENKNPWGFIARLRMGVGEGKRENSSIFVFLALRPRSRSRSTRVRVDFRIEMESNICVQATTTAA